MGKDKLDWFPLDVHLDDKFELIEAEFGLIGFGVVVKLLQKIYGGQGYYAEWTNEVALLFAKKIGLGESVVSEIVRASIKRGIFDKQIYEKHSILTSKGIQERYFKAVNRRKNQNIKNEYLLIEFDQNQKNVNISKENANISDENVSIFSQSRVDKKREDKSTVDNSRAEESNALAHFLKFINPMPSQAVIETISSYTEDGMTDDCIIAIIDYCRDNGKTTWSYIKACIEGNFKDGIRTAEDYRQKQQKFESSKKPKEQTKKTGFNNFEQRDTSYSDLDDDYFAQFAEDDRTPEQIEADTQALLEKHRRKTEE